jgi:hypothetical protein
MSNAAHDDDLKQRIARLEAIEAIKQLKARYLTACDRKQVEVLRACFPDRPVVIDYGPVGSFDHRDGLAAIFEKIACNDHVFDIHLGANPQIRIVDPTHAEGVWGLYFFQIDAATDKMMQLAGYYDDRYELIDGEWKIVETRFQHYSVQMMTLAEGLHRVNFAGRSLADFNWN